MTDGDPLERRIAKRIARHFRNPMEDLVGHYVAVSHEGYGPFSVAEGPQRVTYHRRESRGGGFSFRIHLDPFLSVETMGKASHLDIEHLVRALVTACHDAGR